LQRSQLLLQALSQHTPSAQKPETHWLSPVQLSAFARSIWQVLLMQKRPAAH